MRTQAEVQIPLLKVTSPTVTLSAGVAPIRLGSLVALARLAGLERDPPTRMVRGIVYGTAFSILLWAVAALLII